MFLLISGVILLVLIGVRFYLSPPTRWCRSKRCLVGKTCVITGSNTGIGYETALDFAKRGARVILACRDKSRAEDARSKIIEETDNPNVVVRIVDMSSFASVRAFAKEINETEERLDILVNNAGISFMHNEKTQDGYDFVMQVNYYSHFLLTMLLLGLMKKSNEPSRIVSTSSLAAAHSRNFDPNNVDKFKGNFDSYSDSKLCQILFTKELAKMLQNTKITAYSLHPGAINTDIFRSVSGLAKIGIKIATTLFYKDSSEEGAQTIIYCSVEKGIEKWNGHHFDNCRRVNDYAPAAVPGLPRKLWEATEDIVGLSNQEKISFN